MPMLDTKIGMTAANAAEQPDFDDGEEEEAAAEEEEEDEVETTHEATSKAATKDHRPPRL